MPAHSAGTAAPGPGILRRLPLELRVGLAGALLAALVAWVLLDMLDILGIPVGQRSRIGWPLGMGIAAAAVTLAIRPHGNWPLLRRILAATSAAATLLAVALVINLDAGFFHRVSDLFPRPAAAEFTPTNTLTAPAPADATVIHADAWTPPADQPATGEVVFAQIPPTVSKFIARPAQIWLPPAARVADPPTLPVIVALAGQPGSPADMFVAGEFQTTLEAYAAAHHGLAPIVVAVDQLGTPDANPLCVDGRLGNSRTYLEQDVPAWISANLRVPPDRHAWSFVGFSQGATCAYQIGLDQPARYANVVAVAAERVPSLGTEEATVNQGFRGDRAAYEKSTPAAVMRAHAPYSDTLLIHTVGEADAVFTLFANDLTKVAAESQLTVQRLTAPGSGHDFRTLAWSLRTTLPTLMIRSGMVTA